METIPEEVNEGRRRLQGMKKKKSGQLFYSTHHQHIARPLQTAEVKLAAIAVSLNIRLRSANMPVPMQERAFRYTRTLVTTTTTNNNNNNNNSCTTTTSRSPNPSHIALALKKEFDASYGPAWHCIVGKSFGSFVTHSPGGFLYFSLDNNLSILLFKTEVRPLVDN